MVEDQAVVAVVQFEQSCTGEILIRSILYELTVGDTQPIAHIGKTHYGLVRQEWLHSEPKRLRIRYWGLQFKHGYRFGLRACKPRKTYWH